MFVLSWMYEPMLRHPCAGNAVAYIIVVLEESGGFHD